MKKDNEALKEIGKGLIAFANLFTVLSFINIYMKEDCIQILPIILSIFTFVTLYISGYKLIKRSTI